MFGLAELMMLALWHNPERFVKFSFSLFCNLTNYSRLLYDFAAISGLG